MGIAELKPRQLAPTVRTTGSGSTDSPAPSPSTAARSHLEKSTVQLIIDAFNVTIGDFDGHLQHQQPRGMHAPTIPLLVAPLQDIQDAIYNEFRVSAAS
jgi:hypothetical protein